MILQNETVRLGRAMLVVVLHQRLQFTLRLRHRYAGLGPGYQVVAVGAAAARIGRINLQCGPDLRGIFFAWRKLKVFGHHADDGAFLAVQLSLTANYVRVAAEGAAPGTVGNVRDLLNVLERSVLYSRADVIDAEDLIITCNSAAKDPFAALPEPSDGFKVEEYLGQVRNQLFLRALEACKGNQTAAAELLGVSKQAVSKFVLGQNDNEK